MDLITITRREKLEFSVHVREQDVTSDMSVQDGGSGMGFSPAEMFAGSLGACIAMMVQGYCDRHGYADGSVAVNLAVELADNPKRIGGIVVDIELPNDVPDDRYEVVRRIAERCSIHETLEHPPKVDVDIV